MHADDAIFYSPLTALLMMANKGLILQHVAVKFTNSKYGA